MPTDTTDITKMPMPGGNVNAPASGTYGDNAALERLKQELPSAPTGSAPSAMDPSAPMPVPPTGPAPAPPSGGVPAALMGPTQRPDVPVNTPLDLAAGAPGPISMTGRQRRMQILDALANSPDVSDETREWASLMIEKLVSSSAR